MKYRSTTGSSSAAGFRQAVQTGLAPDGGLYLPDTVPLVMEDLYSSTTSFDLQALAFELLSHFTGVDLAPGNLKDIVRNTFLFPIPLVPCGPDGVHVLELFHGPTWAFKDAGARFLGGCLDAWSDSDAFPTVVLVATSGDTGGAVAHGFYGRKHTEVIILYPKDQITALQEQQIAGPGDNIHAYAVEGSFDDCQRLVKSVLWRQEDFPGIRLTSANSINLGRWLPQTVFYAWAWQEARRLQVPLRLFIPSGNYGNMAAALLCHNMGFHFEQLKAAHNANDTIPRFLAQGIYQPQRVQHTYANAMDVSDPGNFPRFQSLLKLAASTDRDFFQAVSVSDQQILDTIKHVWDHHQYLLDPHTATAWYVMRHSNKPGIVVATAHPFKFELVIRKALGYYPESWRKDFTEKTLHLRTIDASEGTLYEILKRL